MSSTSASVAHRDQVVSRGGWWWKLCYGVADVLGVDRRWLLIADNHVAILVLDRWNGWTGSPTPTPAPTPCHASAGVRWIAATSWSPCYGVMVLLV